MKIVDTAPGDLIVNLSSDGTGRLEFDPAKYSWPWEEFRYAMEDRDFLFFSADVDEDQHERSLFRLDGDTILMVGEGGEQVVAFRRMPPD